MQLRVSSPGVDLRPNDVEGIEHDLEKIDRRLSKYDNIVCEVRISGHQGNPTVHAVVELDYGRNHLIAKADGSEARQAVREAREELLRQINDRSRRGHSWFTKRR